MLVSAGGWKGVDAVGRRGPEKPGAPVLVDPVPAAPLPAAMVTRGPAVVPVPVPVPVAVPAAVPGPSGDGVGLGVGRVDIVYCLCGCKMIELDMGWSEASREQRGHFSVMRVAFAQNTCGEALWGNAIGRAQAAQ